MSINNIVGVTIFIHGTYSGARAYKGWINNAPFLWHWDIANGKHVTNKIIKMDWGYNAGLEIGKGVGDPKDKFRIFGIGKKAWGAVSVMKNVLSSVNQLFENRVPITIVSHSLGTNIALAALQTGSMAENWILMGSPLHPDWIVTGHQNIRFDVAIKNVGSQIINFYSPEDVLGFKLGKFHIDIVGSRIGRDGINKPQLFCSSSNKIKQIKVNGVGHWHWWRGEWMQTLPNKHLTLMNNIFNGSDQSIPLLPIHIEKLREIKRLAISSR